MQANDDASAHPEDPVRLVVSAPDAGQRLDVFLARHLPQLSRSRLKALVLEGAVSGPQGTIGDPGMRVKPGDAISLVLPPPVPAEPRGQDIPLVVVHEDEHVIVIDKPSGLVVHPAPGHAEGTLVNALIAHCGAGLSGIGGVRRPGIVHRLDKDTSGLLVVAKTDAAHRSLSEQFSAHGADGRLHRAYLALAWGWPDRPSGAIDAPLSRSAHNRTKIAVAREGAGRRAVTRYRVVERFASAEGKPLAALLRLELETGRTHQIRVHLAHIGHPVIGDPVYGAGFRTSASRLLPAARAALATTGRQALHAAELGFDHPVTGRKQLFTSALPPDMAGLLAALRAEAAAPGPIPRDRSNRRRR